MKKFVQIFKIPLIIFAVFLVVGIACKVIADNRPKVEFVRNNYRCTTERVFDYADVLTEKEISFRSNVLIVKAGNAGAVRVYTAAGVRVNANVVASDGIVTVDLNGLKEGAYVVSVGKSSFKVLKK